MSRRDANEADLERSKAIVESARTRLAEALRAYKANLHEYEKEVRIEKVMDEVMANDAPPVSGVRSRLIPNWGWNKRSR
jgi:hypothetical protein